MDLHSILKDFDSEDPAFLDRILMYLEELKEEDDLFMETLVNRLAKREITWEQPWYQKTNSVARPVKDMNELHTEKFKTDSICKAENDIIVENWQHFRQEYDVPDKLICLARWKNKGKSRLPNTPEECARRFVIAYLSRGLQRTPYQVMRHIQTYFGGPVKGAYSPEEEKIMKICFTQHPNNCVTLLSMVLGREPRGIYKRLQQMYNGKPEKKRIKWTLPLAARFLKLLMKYTRLPLEELKYKRIDKEVWLKLSKKFKQHYVYLQIFWYSSLHVQVFVKDSIRIKKLRKKIFKHLRSTSYQVWSDIRWKDVVQHFPDGYTHHFLYRISYRIARQVPKYHKKSLSEIINYALTKLNFNRKRRLKILQLNENGELEVVLNK